MQEKFLRNEKLGQLSLQKFQLGSSNIQRRNRRLPSFWKFTVCPAIERSSGFRFPNAAPLFEEKRHVSSKSIGRGYCEPMRYPSVEHPDRFLRRR